MPIMTGVLRNQLHCRTVQQLVEFRVGSHSDIVWRTGKRCRQGSRPTPLRSNEQADCRQCCRQRTLKRLRRHRQHGVGLGAKGIYTRDARLAGLSAGCSYRQKRSPKFSNTSRIQAIQHTPESRNPGCLCRGALVHIFLHVFICFQADSALRKMGSHLQMALCARGKALQPHS